MESFVRVFVLVVGLAQCSTVSAQDTLQNYPQDLSFQKTLVVKHPCDAEGVFCSNAHWRTEEQAIEHVVSECPTSLCEASASVEFAFDADGNFAGYIGKCLCE